MYFLIIEKKHIHLQKNILQYESIFEIITDRTQAIFQEPKRRREYRHNRFQSFGYYLFNRSLISLVIWNLCNNKGNRSGYCKDFFPVFHFLVGDGFDGKIFFATVADKQYKTSPVPEYQ
jgi:hypothetical protein